MGENWIENTLTKKAISFLRTPQKLWVITVIEPSTARGHLSQGPSKNQQQKILEAGPHTFSPNLSMTGSTQLKINVLTFFTYQSLKVNTELLIRKKHKSRLKGCLQKDQCYSNGQTTSNQLRFLLYHEALLFRYPTAMFHTQRLHKTSFTLALMLRDTSSTSVHNYWRYASDLTNHSHRIPKPWGFFVFVWFFHIKH